MQQKRSASGTVVLPEECAGLLRRGEISWTRRIRCGTAKMQALRLSARRSSDRRGRTDPANILIEEMYENLCSIDAVFDNIFRRVSSQIFVDRDERDVRLSGQFIASGIC